MKIVTKDNFHRDVFLERVVVPQVDKVWGEAIVDALNEKYWTEHSEEFFALVADDYEPYDGYKEMYGE